MRFGIRKTLAIVAVYGTLLALLRPLGTVGITAVLVASTALSGTILLARRQDWALIVRAFLGTTLGAAIGSGLFSNGFACDATTQVMGAIQGAIIGAILGGLAASFVTLPRTGTKDDPEPPAESTRPPQADSR